MTHVHGNGTMLLYGKRAALTQLIGPPYTSPSFGSIQPPTDMTWSSRRLEGSNIWEHTCGENVFLDSLLPDRNLFVRAFDTADGEALTLRVAPGDNVTVHVFRDCDFGGIRRDCLALRLPMGNNFFVSLATDRERWLLLSGENLTVDESGDLTLHGRGTLYITAGILPDAVADMAFALTSDPVELIAACDNFWKDFLSRIRDLGADLPEDYPRQLRQCVTAVCESTAILIKAQQSAEGGVQAGNCYPLGYVRDMSGTLRGMLALGMNTEALQILRFWKGRFDLHGDIRNAEGMGHPGRLRFPNDCVEVPAYLIVSAFCYADATGDTAVLPRLWEMLRWAFEVQLPQLAHGMTSFSGDETYIAGRTLPRIHTYDGSAESTLLFILGGRRLMDWAERYHKLPEAMLADYRARIEEAASLYRENFVREGLLYCNAPQRLQYTKKPDFIEGFCEAHDILFHDLRLGWNRYDPGNGYFCCPECCGKPLPPQTDLDRMYLLSSASLLPAFYRSDLFTQEELDGFAAPYVRLFEENGFVPSNSEGTRSLGYDYGLFLSAVGQSERYAQLRVPALEAMLDVLDETGAWVEYYDNGQPSGCPCRPWESGLNVTAISALIFDSIS